MPAQVLYAVLSKRWRVEYGVNNSNSNSHRRLLQAVPYRGKDVPAKRAQFAHADICIGLTQLAYYYSGLSDAQLDDVFRLLDKQAASGDAHATYHTWISQLDQEHRHDTNDNNNDDEDGQRDGVEREEGKLMAKNIKIVIYIQHISTVFSISL